MRNRGKKRKVPSVTFNFSGDKAELAAEALFVQWLDGGMADGFEDFLHETQGLDLSHDWDPETYVFHITTKKSGTKTKKSGIKTKKPGAKTKKSSKNSP